MRQEDVISAHEAIQSHKDKHSILLDTDIGDDIDDALALALALNSPEIDLHGITTVFGDTQKRAQLAKHILHVFGRDDIPISVGVGKPLHQHHLPSSITQAEILGNCPFDREAFSTFSGPELIVQQALEQSGKLTLVCIGPLTNVALALLIEPRIVQAIRGIVMMGGSSGIPLPEWNVRSDVKAASMVLS
jgi:purine nucleosidase